MGVKLLTSGGGSVELVPSATASDFTFTIPASTDTLVGVAATQTLTNKSIVATQLTGTIASARMPIGSVLQVVQTILSTASTVSITAPTYADLGLSATITPSSASNKILVFGNVELGWVTAAAGWIQIVRNSTAVGTGSGGSYANFHSGISISGVTPANNFWSLPFNYLDSPATTSAITYKIQGSLDASATLAINRRQLDTAFGGSSVITLMEISA